MGAGGGVALIREWLKAAREREEAWRAEAHYYRDAMLPILEKQTDTLEKMLKAWDIT